MAKHCWRDSCDLPRYLKASHRHLPPLPTRNRLLLRFLNVAATQEARSEQQLCQNFFFHQRVQLNDSSASNGSFHLLINQVAFGDGSELLALLPPLFFSCVHYNEGATCRNASQSRKPKHPGLKISKMPCWSNWNTLPSRKVMNTPRQLLLPCISIPERRVTLLRLQRSLPFLMTRIPFRCSLCILPKSRDPTSTVRFQTQRNRHQLLKPQQPHSWMS